PQDLARTALFLPQEHDGLEKERAHGRALRLPEAAEFDRHLSFQKVAHKHGIVALVQAVAESSERELLERALRAFHPALPALAPCLHIPEVLLEDAERVA